MYVLYLIDDNSV